MATARVGRISYTRHAMPAVEPVNFVLDEHCIVIRADPGGALAAATRQAVVAFQTDDLSPDALPGWSVTVVGMCQEVTDQVEIARLGALSLGSPAAGQRDHLVRITPGMVTGRRLA
jgi:uncharacterized protein